MATRGRTRRKATNALKARLTNADHADDVCLPPTAITAQSFTETHGTIIVMKDQRWSGTSPRARQGQSRVSHPSVALCARTPAETIQKRCLMGVNEGICDAFLLTAMNLRSTSVVSAHIRVSAGQRFPETSKNI